ncbi:MAG: GNAT family N-acetyltransferase [Candidatus Dormibacteraeota bacterium]|nr:GNAT family N-acetyltransferase [Candidatus Dormibacteraeota bacterium]
MSREGIEFREGTATQEDIQAHLEGCDGNFSPRLSLKVDIHEYSRKVSTKSQTFEAWFGDTLVGLVAAYLTDSGARSGFITNVTVAKAFMGRGIASVLLDRCLDRSRQEGMEAIGLEVSMQSREAIRLYEKLGFSELERKGEIVVMSLTIGEKRQS